MQAFQTANIANMLIGTKDRQFHPWEFVPPEFVPENVKPSNNQDSARVRVADDITVLQALV